MLLSIFDGRSHVGTLFATSVGRRSWRSVYLVPLTKISLILQVVIEYVHFLTSHSGARIYLVSCWDYCEMNAEET